MKNFDGYLKLKLGNDYALLAGGGSTIDKGLTLNNTLNINGLSGSYIEGIRLHQSPAGWNTISLCGPTNTGNSGVTSDTWNIHTNPNNDFFINKGTSSTNTIYRLACIGSTWSINNYTIYHEGNLPAYPTKSSWNYDDRYLKLTGGTLINSDNVLNILSTNSNSWIYFYSTISNTSAARASVGYYSGLAFIANENTYARIGVKDDGVPVYWNSSSNTNEKLLLHTGNWSTYCAAASHTHSYTQITGSGTTANLALVSTTTANTLQFKLLGDRAFDSTNYIPTGGSDVSAIGNTVEWGALSGDSYTPLLQIRSPRISGDYGCFYMAAKPNSSGSDGGTGINILVDGYFYLNGGQYRVLDSNSILNYYWANVKVSDLSNSNTTPTFGNTIINGTVNINNTIYYRGDKTTEKGWRFGGNTTSNDFVGRYSTYMSMWNSTASGAGKNNELVLHDNGDAQIRTGYYLTASGNSGFGTTSPSHRIHASGNIYASQTFISGALLSSIDYTTIPAQSAIAFLVGTGNATGSNVWLWRLNWASNNYGLFFDDTNDYLYWVGGSVSRMMLGTNSGVLTILSNIKFTNSLSHNTSPTCVATWSSNNSANGFTYSNLDDLIVGKAKKLNSTVSLWGNNFDGSNNINSTVRLAFGLLVIIGTQNNNTSSTTSYISAGSGYSKNSGRYGVKVLSCDLTDCQSGLGLDLSGNGGYDMCVVTCASGSTGYGYLSFVSHWVNSTDYSCMGYFKWNNGTKTFTVNGNAYATNFYTTSDARKKQNIHKISDNIKQFKWKETGETSYGFVAQDLEVNHPELVNDDGNMKTVNYNAALSLVVAKLENRVKELEAKLGLETPPLYLTRAKIVKLPSFSISKMEERRAA